MVTDTTQTGGCNLLEVVGAAVAGGARAVLLRDKQLPPPVRRTLAAELAGLLEPVGGLLLVASSRELVPPAVGLHLAASDRCPPGRPALLGRSCHDHQDLHAAAAEGCDYAFLSPIHLSTSKPGYGPALGPAALGGAPLPVYGLGGIDGPDAAAGCVAAGAAGVAVMGTVMRADDPASVVAALLGALA